MSMRTMFLLVISAVLLSCSTVLAQEPGAVKRGAPVVRNMDITGEIAKSEQGYIIRGKKPAEIFTVLNPHPAVLDTYVKTGKIVRLTVRIVSGDNVNIEKIDGKPYRAAGQDGKKAPSAPR